MFQEDHSEQVTLKHRALERHEKKQAVRGSRERTFYRSRNRAHARALRQKGTWGV